MERIVRVNFGDWSSDGHGIHETHVFRLSGQDVSDEALATSYERSVEEFNRDLSEVCSSYEETSISQAFYEQLLEAGFTTDEEQDPWPCITVEGVLTDPEDEYSELQIGADELLMFYVGRFIEDFEWEAVVEEMPTLIGGFGTIIKQERRGWPSSSFGYGLFSN